MFFFLLPVKNLMARLITTWSEMVTSSAGVNRHWHPLVPYREGSGKGKAMLWLLFLFPHNSLIIKREREREKERENKKRERARKERPQVEFKPHLTWSTYSPSYPDVCSESSSTNFIKESEAWPHFASQSRPFITHYLPAHHSHLSLSCIVAPTPP